MNIKYIFAALCTSVLIFGCASTQNFFTQEPAKSNNEIHVTVKDPFANGNDLTIIIPVPSQENLFKPAKVSREMYAQGTKDEKELIAFFTAHCPNQNHFRARQLARLYIEECAAEGINSDIAFVQMCHETNFLRFGNLVKKEWNNFCGLGAISAEQPGLRFKTMRLGVRAHVQHLHAYATTEDIALKNELVDPRYKYVRPRGKATTIQGLAGTWAADKAYSEKLEKYLCELEKL